MRLFIKIVVSEREADGFFGALEGFYDEIG